MNKNRQKVSPFPLWQTRPHGDGPQHYSIKFVGNSNSVFLVPPGDQSALLEHPQYSDEKYVDQRVDASVIKVAPGNMELVEVAPRLDKLKLLLLENPYTSEELSDKEELYKWNDLIDRVQASDDELRSQVWITGSFCSRDLWVLESCG